MHTSVLESVNNRIKVIKRMAYGFGDSGCFFLKIKAAFSGKHAEKKKNKNLCHPHHEGVRNRIKVAKHKAYRLRGSDHSCLKIKATFPGKAR